MNLDVLYEDNHCLAVTSPRASLRRRMRPGSASLVDPTEYLQDDTRSRETSTWACSTASTVRRRRDLTRPDQKAAGRLSAQFRERTIRKVYWAIVEGRPAHPVGEWVDRLEKDHRMNRSRTLAEGSSDGKEARVAFRVLECSGGVAKLELRPETGRSHQLRAQLAARGLPIVGDAKYGATTRIVASDGRGRIGLHARELTFKHPTRGEAIAVVARAGRLARALDTRSGTRVRVQ